MKLEILRIVFTIIEDSNTALQAVCMNFRKAEDTIKLLKTILLNDRCDDCFQLFWEGALKSLEKYKLEEPVLPRKRKVPARHDGQGEHHFSANPEDHYRALYFQTLDDVIMGLTTQFEPTESSIHLSEMEKFIIGECDVSYIKDFYKEDFEDYARLQLHRDIVADQAKSKNVKLENFESALQLMKDILVPLVSEFAKLLRIIHNTLHACVDMHSREVLFWPSKTQILSVINYDPRTVESCGSYFMPFRYSDEIGPKPIT